MEATDCDTLQVMFTVYPLPNPLPNGNNTATLQSLEVTYRPVVGGGSTETRSFALNGSGVGGVLCITGLTTNTGYRVTYNVEVNTPSSVTLLTDLSAPAEVPTLSNCVVQGQCTETSSISECTLHVQCCSVSLNYLVSPSYPLPHYTSPYLTVPSPPSLSPPLPHFTSPSLTVPSPPSLYLPLPHCPLPLPHCPLSVPSPPSFYLPLPHCPLPLPHCPLPLPHCPLPLLHCTVTTPPPPTSTPGGGTGETSEQHE